MLGTIMRSEQSAICSLREPIQRRPQRSGGSLNATHLWNRKFDLSSCAGANAAYARATKWIHSIRLAYYRTVNIGGGAKIAMLPPNPLPAEPAAHLCLPLLALRHNDDNRHASA
jgi:hypothetical protein